MTKRQRVARLNVFFGFVVLTLVVFSVRLFQIQGIDAHDWATMATKATAQEATIPATRGDIVDRNGEILAGTIDAVAITADPSMTNAEAPRIAKILTSSLGNKSDYFELIETLRKPDSRFVYIERRVPKWKASAILKQLNEQKLVGIFTEAETLRTYPGGTLAANAIGFLDGSGTGVAGIEKSFNEALTGENGIRHYAISPQGERLPQSAQTSADAVPGKTVMTTLDRDLQWYADQKLAEAVDKAHANWGLAITMDVTNGEILQYSQYPTFNPDKRKNMTSDRTVSRAVQNVYEPGSVQKVLTMSTVVEEGKATAETKIKIPSKMEVGGFTISDAWDHGVLKLTAAGVLAKSSNIGTMIAANELTNEQLHARLVKFGLGSKTGIELPGESKGLLNDASTWRKSNKATISFGQGVSVTAMQMISAVGAVGNKGVYVKPTIVKGVVEDGSLSTQEPQTHRVISEATAAEVLRMMEMTVTDEGSSPAAKISGYRVAGKSGTAWRVNPKTGRYVRGQYTVSFIGIAPADNPRFVTYIVIDNPGGGASGGATAAPVFRDIMAAALQRYAVLPTGAKKQKTPLTW